MSQLMPRKLKPGDTICILAPGSPVGGEGPYAAGKAYLERKGYRVVEGEHVKGRHLIFSGEDHQRAADVNAAFSDPSIDAIFCARGGTGTLRLLHLRWHHRLENEAPDDSLLWVELRLHPSRAR